MYEGYNLWRYFKDKRAMIHSVYYRKVRNGCQHVARLVARVFFFSHTRRRIYDKKQLRVCLLANRWNCHDIGRKVGDILEFLSEYKHVMIFEEYELLYFVPEFPTSVVH